MAIGTIAGSHYARESRGGDDEERKRGKTREPKEKEGGKDGRKDEDRPRTTMIAE